MLNSISKYNLQFSKLKRAYQHGGAPHKPIMLLSILEGFSRGEIISNQIEITPELIMCFKEYWSKLVFTPHQMNFALPFYHMRSEPFWKLVCKPGFEIALTTSNSVKSLSSLNDSLLYAEIDSELFLLMSDPVTNGVLRMTLVKTYFPNEREVKVNYELLKNIESQILHESQAEYHSRIQTLQNSLSKEEVQEELFVRSGIFKREVPKLYNYTCAISRMRVASASNVQMVDACHIVPFSISKDDTIGNGISLSPNLHRAFDRGLISIDSDYGVLVSSKLKEDNTPFAISNFNGSKILLPESSKFYPAMENLNWHFQNTFIGSM
jgi:putative restriction endonuclease